MIHVGNVLPHHVGFVRIGALWRNLTSTKLVWAHFVHKDRSLVRFSPRCSSAEITTRDSEVGHSTNPVLPGVARCPLLEGEAQPGRHPPSSLDPCEHTGSGAGNGNRTRAGSLGSFHSTFELHPQMEEIGPSPRPFPERANVRSPEQVMGIEPT